MSDDVSDSCLIVIHPAGDVVTYGIGVPPRTMPHPQKSLARVPVGA